MPPIALAREIQRNQRNIFQLDVLPYVELGPVAQGKDTHAFPVVDIGVVQVPQLGALVLGVPLAKLVAHGKKTLFGPGLFLVAPGAAERGVEAVLGDGIQQGTGLQLLAALVVADS